MVDEDAMGLDRIVEDRRPLRYPFLTGRELLEQCTRNDLSVSQLMAENEKAWRSPEQTRQGLLHIWQVMADFCLSRLTEIDPEPSFAFTAN